MSGNINYISIPRLFPTRFVASMYGITNFVAHLFACFAPLVAEMREPYPFMIYLVLNAISTIVSYNLIELEAVTKEDEEDGDGVEINFDGLKKESEVR